MHTPNLTPVHNTQDFFFLKLVYPKNNIDESCTQIIIHPSNFDEAHLPKKKNNKIFHIYITVIIKPHTLIILQQQTIHE